MKRLMALALAGLLATGLTVRADKAEDAAKYTETLKKGKDAKAKATAAEEIGKLAQIKADYGRDAVPLLVEALKDKDATLREKAALALGRCDPETEVAMKPLLKLVTSEKEDVKVRTAAAEALGLMGQNAKDAVKEMREVAGKTDDRRFRKTIQVAINAISGRTKK
jgi:HEAT repeat protein